MLLEKLIQKQKELGENDSTFATRLGIARSTWHRTKSGDIRVAESILSGAIKSFPELTAEIIIFLSSNVSKLSDNDNLLTKQEAS